MFRDIRVDHRLFFELFLKTFYYFINNSDFELPKFPFEIFSDYFIQLSHWLSKFRIEVIFDNIISSWLIIYLLARKLHSNESPFISNLVMKFEEFLLLFFAPFRLNKRIKVLLVSKWFLSYLSRHCFAFRGKLCYSVSLRAMIAHLVIFSFSYKFLIMLSYSSVKGRLSGITIWKLSFYIILIILKKAA